MTKLFNKHPCLECALANWVIRKEGRILYDGDHVIFLYNNIASDQNGRYDKPLDNMLPIELEDIHNIRSSFRELSLRFRLVLEDYYMEKGAL